MKLCWRLVVTRDGARRFVVLMKRLELDAQVGTQKSEALTLQMSGNHETLTLQLSENHSKREITTPKSE